MPLYWVSPHSLGIGLILFIVTHLEEGQLCFIGWKKNRDRDSTVRPNGIYTKNFTQLWPKMVCLNCRFTTLINNDVQ